MSTLFQYKGDRPAAAFLQVHENTPSTQQQQWHRRAKHECKRTVPLYVSYKAVQCSNPRLLACQTLKMRRKGASVVDDAIRASTTQTYTRGRENIRAAKSPASPIVNNGAYFSHVKLKYTVYLQVV